VRRNTTIALGLLLAAILMATMLQFTVFAPDPGPEGGRPVPRLTHRPERPIN
jgi:hypothetical protein